MDVLSFPNDLVYNILANWLQMSDVAVLDSAYCSLHFRPDLHLAFTHPLVVFSGLSVGLPSNAKYFSWLKLRNVSVREVVLNGKDFNHSRLAVLFNLSNVSSLRFENAQSLQCLGLEMVLNMCLKLKILKCHNILSLDDSLFYSPYFLQQLEKLEQLHISGDNTMTGFGITALSLFCFHLKSIKLEIHSSDVEERNVSKLIENNKTSLTAIDFRFRIAPFLRKTVECIAKHCDKITHLHLENIEDFNNETIPIATLLPLFEKVKRLNQQEIKFNINISGFWLDYSQVHYAGKRYDKYLKLENGFEVIHTPDIKTLLEICYAACFIEVRGYTFPVEDVNDWNGHYAEYLWCLKTLIIGNNGGTFSYEALKSIYERNDGDMETLVLEHCSHITNAELINALNRNALMFIDQNAHNAIELEVERAVEEIIANMEKEEDIEDRAAELREERERERQRKNEKKAKKAHKRSAQVDSTSDPTNSNINHNNSSSNIVVNGHSDEDSLGAEAEFEWNEENIVSNFLYHLVIRYNTTIDNDTIIDIVDNMKHFQSITIKSCPNVNKAELEEYFKPNNSTNILLTFEMDDD